MSFHLRTKSLRAPAAGFTLVEILLTIALMAILTGVSVSLLSKTSDQELTDSTILEMRSIRRALVGDSTVIENGRQAFFGFLGDNGTLPTSAQGVSALLNPLSFPVWYNVDSSMGLYAGWKGPYLKAGNP